MAGFWTCLKVERTEFTDGLTMNERERESRRTLRFLAQATGRSKLPLMEMGKPRKEQAWAWGLGKWRVQ